MNEGNELFKKNQGLVYYTIKHFYPNFTKDDDVSQTALIALWRASENYRYIGVAFSTYAIQSIRRNVNRYLSKERKHNENVLSLDNESTEDESYIALVHSDIEDAEFKADYERFLLTLTPQQKEVVTMILDGYYQVEIADKLKLSRSRVSDIIKEIGTKWDTYKK